MWSRVSVVENGQYVLVFDKTKCYDIRTESHMSSPLFIGQLQSARAELYLYLYVESRRPIWQSMLYVPTRGGDSEQQMSGSPMLLLHSAVHLSHGTKNIRANATTAQIHPPSQPFPTLCQLWNKHAEVRLVECKVYISRSSPLPNRLTCLEYSTEAQRQENNMEPLEEKSIKVSRGFTYRYYISPATSSNNGKAPLMLHHGFPDTANLWAPLLPMLTKLPNRLIVPDLLGYGGTSKPTEPQAYAYDLMSRDLLDILDAERVEKVISVGHDHGAGSAARFYNHAPDRTAGLILLNVAYQIPSKDKDFDLNAINTFATKAFGYPVFEYWNFLTAPDAASVLDQNLDRMFDCMHAGTFESKKSLYCVPDGMRQYLTDHSIERIETKPYSRDETFKQRWMSQFQEGGFAGAVCWYTSQTGGVQFASNKKIQDANVKVTVPTLFIGCDKDTVCRMELIKGPNDAGLLPDLRIETMEGIAHWPMYEDPKGTAERMIQFLEERHL